MTTTDPTTATGAVTEAGAGTAGAEAGPGTGWEVVVGLEVHAELATRTKLFSSARNEFGGEPNTHIDPTSLGLPGSLPVLNERAVELAIRVGLALGCEIRPSVFARKNYFYPDMPKDFQISQYDQPINVGGSLELPSGKRVGIERAHLEEDTGKSTHVGTSGRISGADFSLVDYNRAGVPLLEIVGRPDLRSAEEAVSYVEELRAVLVAIGASDGKLEEGSLRVDANVSVHRPGEPFGTRCEIKNVNSLRSLRRAIDYEAARQVEVLEAGGRVRQETRHWDEAAGRTLSGRSKEEAEDYRYFPEPDLVPVAPDAEWVARVQAAMPLLPAERRARLAAVAGATATEPQVVIACQRGLDDLAVAAIEAGAEAGRVLTHVEHNLAVEGAEHLDPAAFAELVGMEVGGELTATQTKAVLAELLATGGAGDPRAIAAAKGFEAMDTSALEGVIDEVVAANPAEWDRFVSEPAQRGKLSGFFVGKVMKATRGQADGKAVTASLLRRAG